MGFEQRFGARVGWEREKNVLWIRIGEKETNNALNKLPEHIFAVKMNRFLALKLSTRRRC